MKKRFSLAAAITVIFMLVFAGSAFAAFSDVTQDNPYYDAITTLSKLETANPVIRTVHLSRTQPSQERSLQKLLCTLLACRELR